MNYTDFLSSKHITVAPAGFTVAPAQISPVLFDWQNAIVRWALLLGKAALFEECGLGKTFQQVEWARHVAAHTGGQVLILAPLAVAHQTISEAAKLGVTLTYVRNQAECHTAGPLVITNYDMLKAFDTARFAGVVLDESSILKAFSGITKKRLVEAFAQTPYKLCCTATPSPNDVTEIGNHADFLGIMPSHEMLARWFINDQGKAGHYRLKGHAQADFWRWVTSWAVCISKPSDLGVQYADQGFVLPPLELHEHTVASDYARAQEHGRLFFDESVNATAIWAEKRATLDERVALAAALVQAEPNEPWIVWCDTNDEASALQALLPDAVEVRGSHSVAEKERRLSSFSDGESRIIITKADIAGFGLNWQHCGRQVFAGYTFSFEKIYQALRRSLRYGRQGPVHAHLICAESEGNIRSSFHAKQEQHTTMQQQMNSAMAEHGLFRDDAARMLHAAESDIARGDNWTLYLGDCVTESKKIADASVDFSIFSPPFSSLYIYSDSNADMGNCASDAEFFEHFNYLIPELHRITIPGRLCAVHCKDLPRYQSAHGAAGLYDFPGALTRAFEAHGWQFHSRITIWKNPQIESTRTNNYGLLFASFTNRAEVTRQGMADYVLVFRKWAEGMDVGQVKQSRKPGDYIGLNPPPTQETDRDYAIQLWQRYASPVWFDIDQTRVLNYQIARQNEDEKHICPLQLDVIARCIDLWTMPGHTVFSPFAGVGSEGYEALRLGRKFIGIELKRAYWDLAQRYLNQAAFDSAQPTMFDMAELEVI